MSNAVLVVGGAGYVGAHSSKALSRAGFRPVVFDNLSVGHDSFVKWGPLVKADIRDTPAIVRALREFDIGIVLHFAAYAEVGESVTNPQKYYENNVCGTLSLLRAMLEAGCSNLVFSSTCAVYGQASEVPLKETSPMQPINPYGRSKLMVERILEDYRSAYGLNATILRYFNACGADPDGDVGELRNPESHLIPRAMMALLGHIDDFQVFGADFDTADGTAIRDYVHVSDLAEAHVAAARMLLAGQPGATLNLGSTRGYSVKEVLAAIANETGRELAAVAGPRRPGDPPILLADATLAERLLGFRPQHSNLATIIRTAWAWHQSAHPQR